MAKRLEELKTKHPSIGDVRYIGLFSGLELVKNRETKEPMDLTPLKNFLIANGYMFSISKMCCLLCPPLVITEEQLDEGLDLLDEGLAELMDKQTS